MSISELRITIDMRKTLLILSFLTFLASAADAQVTTVMKVSVTIVSGAKTEIPSNLFLSDNPNDAKHGEIIITSSPNSDVAMYSDENCELTNDLGEVISIETGSLLETDSTSGTYKLSLNGALPTDENLSGNYRGHMVTTIVYL